MPSHPVFQRFQDFHFSQQKKVAVALNQKSFTVNGLVGDFSEAGFGLAESERFHRQPE